jgi:hypothetical protein
VPRIATIGVYEFDAAGFIDTLDDAGVTQLIEEPRQVDHAASGNLKKPGRKSGEEHGKPSVRSPELLSVNAR